MLIETILTAKRSVLLIALNVIVTMERLLFEHFYFHSNVLLFSSNNFVGVFVIVVDFVQGCGFGAKLFSIENKMAGETTTTTNAERCKRYREKNKEEYRINDALRKKQKRTVLKTLDKVKYEEQKKKDRERKRLSKLKKSQATPSSATSALEATEAASSSPFSNSAVKSRTVKRVEKCRPQSPRRKTEVIKSLASKFNVKVKFGEKSGRKKNLLSEEEQQWVLNFLDRADISYTTPGRRDNVYIGVFNKVKKYAQKRYLLWKIRDIFDIINGSKIMENVEIETYESKFGKKITFRQLYDMFKKNKQYIFNKKIPQWSCLCEICENATFLVNGMNKKLFPECRLPETVNELVAKFSCSTDDENCMNTRCNECKSTGIMLTNFNIESQTDTDDASSEEPVDDERNDSEEFEKDYVRYYEWARGDDNKLMKMMSSKSAENSIGLLDTTIQVLKRHLYVKRVQCKFYDDFKKNLGKNDLLVHVDYSESYENKQQREIQSAYFGHTTFSIFTACCYLRNNEDKVICESVTITSELPDHSRAAAITCVLKVIEHMREIHNHLPLKINAMVWSDGCASQFRSRYVFKLLSGIDSSINLTWCYNERHHGKGPMDGVGGTLKNSIYRDVMSGKCVIDTPKQFADYAQQSIKGLTSLYLPAAEVMAEPVGIDLAPKIPETLQVHMVRRLFNDQKVPYLEFSKTASDTDPYFTQFYGEGACGHPENGTNDNHCGYCEAGYVLGEEWLQCPMCAIWFHKDCFYE